MKPIPCSHTCVNFPPHPPGFQDATILGYGLPMPWEPWRTWTVEKNYSQKEDDIDRLDMLPIPMKNKWCTSSHPWNFWPSGARFFTVAPAGQAKFLLSVDDWHGKTGKHPGKHRWETKAESGRNVSPHRTILNSPLQDYIGLLTRSLSGAQLCQWENLDPSPEKGRNLESVCCFSDNQPHACIATVIWIHCGEGVSVFFLSFQKMYS